MIKQSEYVPGPFRVTYSAVTAESCEQGDYSERGWIDPIGYRWVQLGQCTEPAACGWTLRELWERFAYSSPEPSCSPVDWSQWDQHCWLTADCEDFMDLGSDEIGLQCGIHPGSTVTAASWRRVCRLLATGRWRR